MAESDQTHDQAEAEGRAAGVCKTRTKLCNDRLSACKVKESEDLATVIIFYLSFLIENTKAKMFWPCQSFEKCLA